MLTPAWATILPELASKAAKVRGGRMPGQQQGGSQSGQKPEDKMNKDWERSRDTGSQGG